MSTSAFPPISESQILTSYLLPPSPLPTILPFSSFLALVPTPYRHNPDYASSIKRLYRDLQFQRDITLSQVQENVERECGGNAATLRAGLARRIAIDEGEVEGIPKRKRQRVEWDAGDEDEGSSTSANDQDQRVKEEEVVSSDDEFTNPLRLQVQEAFQNDSSALHPAADVLKLPDDMLNERSSLEGKSRFHTTASLLEAMENASESVGSQISELEVECERLKDEIQETVGGLSDLRYGKTSKQKEAEIGEAAGEYKEILDALSQFRNLLKVSSSV